MRMEKKWAQLLREEFDKPYMTSLKEFLNKEMETKIIYPPKDLIFNAFCQTPFDSVKVVIVGQDPYHGANQAEGLSFSVPQNIPQPPSLKNIFKELNRDMGIPIPKNGSLLKWAQRGVFLLNAILTVEEGKPLSHQGRGWEIFTDKVVEILLNREDPLVFLLWGKSAQDKVNCSSERHLILKAPHPSPFSAYNGFFGCSHFSKANNFLKNCGKKPIDWCLD